MKLPLKTGLSAIGLLVPLIANATYSGNPAISATLATGTPGQRLQSVRQGNPASLSYLIADDEHLRMALVNQFSFGTDFADFGSIDGKYISLSDCMLRDAEQCTAPFNDLVNAPSDLTEYLALFGTIESDFLSLSNDAYLLGRTSASIPLYPIVIRLPNRSVVSFDASTYFEGRASLLSDSIVLDNDGDVTTDTSAYTKQAAVATYSLGYGQSVWGSDTNELSIGTRLNLSYAVVGKQVIGLMGSENGDTISEDLFINSYNHEPLISIDAGLLWSSSHFTAGLTFNNINQPSIDYGSLGLDCLSLDQGIEQNNCLLAAVHADKIDRNETHIRSRQFTLDGSLYTLNRHASISGQFDLNPVYSLTGELEQYVGVGTTYYNPNRYLLTGTRLGYSKNLVGRGMSYYSGGLTLLGGIDLDLTIAQFATFDGLSLPRALSIALGINEKF